MTAASAPHVAHNAASAKTATYFLSRRLHSLTGVVFSGYVVVHLLINFTLVQGTNPDVYQAQVDKIHSLPLLPAIEWTFIYLPIIYHTLFGIWIAINGRPNAGTYQYTKNWFYVFQRISAIVLVLFILFHVLSMKGVFGGEMGRALTFVPETYATQSTVNHMHAAFWVAWVIYPIGILAGTYHLANGLWTAAITWGVTISAAAQKRWGLICTGIFAFTTFCAFGALIAASRATPAVLSQQDHYVRPDKGGITPSNTIKALENTVTGNDEPLPQK